MKRVVINIKNDKYRFFMELIRSFDFVQIQEDTGDSKEEITSNLTAGFEDSKRFRKGKLKTTPAKDFLNEL